MTLWRVEVRRGNTEGERRVVYVRNERKLLKTCSSVIASGLLASVSTIPVS